LNICDNILARNRIQFHIKIFLPIFAVLLLLLSCEELINVNLKNESSIVVIESFITSADNPVMVKITKSQDFFNQSDFSTVKNASVQLVCSSVKETLIEKGGGYYFSSKTKGIQGKTYSLNITTEGKTFGASVVLPKAVPIDTIYFQPGIFQSDSLNIFVGFHDPAVTENYYRIRLYRNRRYAINDYFLMTDAFSDGERIVAPIYYRYFAPGDTVVIELLNLERCTWKYFKGLSESIQQGVNSQAPGNPPTNFTGGALGIFGAWGLSSCRIIVPQQTGKK